ncbi:50S ribosomal protein L18 [Desulfolucanica intricata]|uniref:50S ribosomal protein L18 n=1 Tax=Desulfolucanica intricata TaxID=1285191 RepID=UPI00083038B8|nr:50S ribosomal protein L18 [Desulfolucanica intricata]
MISRIDRKADREKRRRRVRNKVMGTTERPRLNVFRSLNHIYAQVIDDERGITLVAASSLEPEVKGKIKTGGNISAAAAVGEQIAKKAITQGIKRVVFDRAGYLYHGRVKALAEAARAGGLEF